MIFPKLLADIKVKKLNNLATIPTRGSDHAAGYDLYAATDYTIDIAPHSTVKVGTGLSFELPEGTFAAIFARSGIATKRGLRPANCVGVCDSDYRGEIIVPIHNDTNNIQYILPEERIAQLVISPIEYWDIEEVDTIENTDRNTGGFGSTGKK